MPCKDANYPECYKCKPFYCYLADLNMEATRAQANQEPKPAGRLPPQPPTFVVGEEVDQVALFVGLLHGAPEVDFEEVGVVLFEDLA